MSKESLQKINKIYHTVVFIAAAAMAIAAAIYNPYHLLTVAVAGSYGLSIDIVNKDDADLI